MDGHYRLRLPFRRDEVSLPDNRHVAEQRFSNLQRKFKRNQAFHEEYEELVTEVIDKGYAEAVPQGQLRCKDGKVWYIPHNGVYHLKKGKLVFDIFQGHLTQL